MSAPEGRIARMNVLRLGRRTGRDRPTDGESRLKDLVLITGLSGAGKSTAMQFFEDAGYFCVDNLPPEMIRSLAELFMHEGSKVESAAVVCDARGGAYFDSLVEVVDALRDSGVNLRVLYLEADEQTLITRYKETRRRHPLATSGSVADGITEEDKLVAPLRERADFVIDTTGLRPGHLRNRLAEDLLPAQTPSRLAVTFTSFGHKHGPLRDADLVLDVRFLPNPHYDAKLRPLTGLDDAVIAYINRDGALDGFYEHLFPLLDYLLPQYVREGKAHLVVGIGCTGGRHRSVVIAEALRRRYADSDDYLVEVAHRDVEKAPGGLAAAG
jgi:RNase adapter protein RapZ